MVVVMATIAIVEVTAGDIMVIAITGTMAMAITHFILGRTIISPTIPIHITVTVATEAAAPIGAADARGIGVMGTAITTAACAIMAAGRL
ncbi:MAG: hypothetical protein WBP94_11350 [Rhodomicrobiaceae bacterium]